MTAPANFVTRAQWGSAFNYGSNTHMPATCKGVALHWEGGGLGTFAHSACAGKVRSIEAFHTHTRGWAGIAYNAIVCPHGYIFEGRGTKYRSAANGDVPKNNAHFAVCFLGGKGDAFTTEAKAGFIRAVQWLRADGGAGKAVIGHRDVTATECPGAQIEAWLKATDFGGGATTPPAKTTAAWGKPETFVLGAVGPDVTRLGERIEIWSKALGLPDPYKVGPGEPLGPADVTGLSRIQLKWWPKASTELGGDADGYPGAETFKRLAADPVERVEAVTVVQNIAGYNAPGQPGLTKYKTHIPSIAKAVMAIKADVFSAQEVSNKQPAKMRPLLDTCLKPVMTRAPGGTDGRYCFTSTAVKRVASGNIVAAKKTWFRNDDKQAAWTIYTKAGALAMDVSFHLESDAGATPDALRVAQMLNILAQALAIADKYKVPHENILFAGDTNSEGMVAKAMGAAGWPAIANTTPTFRGWGRTSSKRFDYGFVRSGVVASCGVVKSTDSDHERLVIKRQLVK
jgi:hypothetical protein